MNREQISAAVDRQGLLSEWRDKETGVINRVYRYGNTVVYEGEETIFPDSDGTPEWIPPEQMAVRVTKKEITKIIPLDGHVIEFGYKSVDGLGQVNLAKIKNLKVDGSSYVADLIDGAVINAHGIADFAKRLRAHKL